MEPPRRRKKSKNDTGEKRIPKTRAKPYMDGFSSSILFDKLSLSGNWTEIEKRFPRDKWFHHDPNVAPPYYQFGSKIVDSEGRRYGFRQHDPVEQLVDVALPWAKNYHEEGRKVNFPAIDSIVDLPHHGSFIVREVIVSKGRTNTGTLRVQWLVKNVKQ